MSVKFELVQSRGEAVEMIRVPVDGGMHVAVRPATDDDKTRYPAEYKAFKGDVAPAPVPVADIPVSELPEPPKALMDAFAETAEHKPKKHHK